jgi:hypothetical protein
VPPSTGRTYLCSRGIGDLEALNGIEIGVGDVDVDVALREVTRLAVLYHRWGCTQGPYIHLGAA